MAASNSRALGYLRSALSRAIPLHRPLTTPSAKPDAASVAGFISHRPATKKKRFKEDYIPVAVALGMIALSTSLGLYTAEHQLVYAPNVFVRKKKRETIPEVVDPDEVVEEADKFVRKSLFRRIGRILDIDELRGGITDPTRPDPFTAPRKVETLKHVGVEPVLG